MKTPSLALLLSLVGVVSLHAGIDLTPVPGERVLEGIKFPQLNFQQNGRRITYEQPRGWTYAGGGSRISFTPPDAPQAQAEINQSPLPAPQSFDEETMKLLRAKTLAAVPPDSQNTVLVSEEKNPLRIANHETYAVTVSYSAGGQEFMTSILYLNLPDTQLRFRTTARKGDFEKVHGAFRGSNFSWQWK